MSAGRARVSRRTFLQFSSALALGGAARLPRRLSVLSALPLPVPHAHYPNAMELARRVPQADAALVPAYLAAELIQAGALRPLSGPPNRAHDPEGAFTVPHALLQSALIYRHAPRAAPSLDDLFASHALWPADARLVIGAALHRRGHALNDTHPGHLIQVQQDLLSARPCFVRDPFAALQQNLGSVALTLMSATDRGAAHLPAPGGFAVEYDWVIPRATAQPEAAERFIRVISEPSTVHRQPSTVHWPLPTFCPLPAAARARYAALWASL